MQKFILTVFTIFLTASFSLCATTNSYDKYCNKTGSFKTNLSGITTQYNKYGNKVGSFKKRFVW